MIAGNVDRKEPSGEVPRQEGVQDEPDFRQGTGAKLYQVDFAPHTRGNLARVIRQNPEFRPCDVVLRKCADLVEKPRSEFVIEVLRRQALTIGIRGLEASKYVSGKLAGRGERYCHGGSMCQTSRARRIPANCQRALGGKKLRYVWRA
jgi:hypothetical protein